VISGRGLFSVSSPSLLNLRTGIVARFGSRGYKIAQAANVPAKSLSSGVRKCAEARSAGSMKAVMIAAMTVTMPSRIY
jgi:hypothetical protein